LVTILSIKQTYIWQILVMMNDFIVSVFIWRIFQSYNRADWKVYSTRGENSPGQKRKCHCFFAYEMFLVKCFVYWRSVVNFFVCNWNFCVSKAVSLYEENVRVRSVMSSLPWNENRTIICTILVSAIGPKNLSFFFLKFLNLPYYLSF